VSGLMDQTCEFFSRRLARKESDPAAVGDAQCRSDLFVVFKGNVLSRKEVDKAVPVDPNLSRNAVAELWNIIPDSLALVPRIYGPECEFKNLAISSVPTLK